MQLGYKGAVMLREQPQRHTILASTLATAKLVVELCEQRHKVDKHKCATTTLPTRRALGLASGSAFGSAAGLGGGLGAAGLSAAGLAGSGAGAGSAGGAGSACITSKSFQ